MKWSNSKGQMRIVWTVFVAGALTVCSVAFLLHVAQIHRSNYTMKASTLLEGGDDYKKLLHREKHLLHSGRGGLDWGNKRLLLHASKEQDLYIENKNKMALKEAKKIQKTAAQLYHKWTNPYAGTIYEKYDKPVAVKARTVELALVDDTAAKLRQLSAESKAKQREAQASCKGDAGCEQVLQQVLSLYHVGTSS